MPEQQTMSKCVPSGFVEFDRLTGGFHPGDLIILASRPSMGKSAFALNVVRNAALKGNIPVMLFSLEMSMKQVAGRIAVELIDAKDFRATRATPKSWSNRMQEMEEPINAPIFCDDTPSQNLNDILAASRLMKEEHDIGLVVIDYLNLITTENHESSAVQERRFTHALKAIAMELHIPVLALCQVNRTVEEREDKRPTLFDLRWASEEDADVVCFVYRDEMYNKSPDAPRRGITEVILSKNKNGPVATIELAFINDTAMFGDISLGLDNRSA